MIFINNLINLLSTAMDGAMERQNRIANNIANVNTPHYQRQDIDFISALKSSLEKEKISVTQTNKEHFPHLQSKSFVNKFNNFQYRNDGNNVDIEVEMAEMAKNNLYYNTLVQELNKRFRMLSDTINRGGR